MKLRMCLAIVLAALGATAPLWATDVSQVYPVLALGYIILALVVVAQRQPTGGEGAT